MLSYYYYNKFILGQIKKIMMVKFTMEIPGV